MESDDESGPQAVDYDGRYRKGWAYGKEPSDFLVQAAASYLKPPMEILTRRGLAAHGSLIWPLGHSRVRRRQIARRPRKMLKTRGGAWGGRSRLYRACRSREL